MSTIHDDLLAVTQRLWHAMTDKQRALWSHAANEHWDGVVEAFDLLDAASNVIAEHCDAVDSQRCWSCALVDCLSGEGPHPGKPPCGHSLQ